MTLSDGKAVFDVMHVEHLRGARYGLYMKSLRSTFPVVWDSVDCISLLFRRAAMHSKSRVSRMITRFELKRTEQYEGWLQGKFDRTLVTSPADKDALLSLEGRRNNPTEVTIVPNGVDLDYFLPHTPARREPATLVISGKMSYHANISMVMYLMENIMPHIWAIRPEVKLWIVGKDPAPNIRQLADRKGVTITGYVEDLRPYLQKATVALAPLTYGAGIQNKVLEAMACATPVVATPRASAALAVQSGHNIIIEENPVDFANQVLDLLGHPDRACQIGENGRKFVESFHNWVTITTQLEAIFSQSVKSG
jgi:glycosyltransferase involved in cell wall biosynthesis